MHFQSLLLSNRVYDMIKQKNPRKSYFLCVREDNILPYDFAMAYTASFVPYT